MTNNFSYEKTVIFGGITYSAVREGEDLPDISKDPITHLSNDMYVIEVRNI